MVFNQFYSPTMSSEHKQAGTVCRVTAANGASQSIGVIGNLTLTPLSLKNHFSLYCIFF